MYTRNYLPIFFVFCTIILIILNLFALMRLIPYLITLPLLFLSIYLTIYTFTYRKMFRGTKHF
ncbi:hypothetical protein ACFSKI_02270 [Pseudogracilibacillus auburnensis]|uniref:hypothetical protein n=1 Tax=Pseudogracilibacillus auburnensis TaxID=1494959 RepID=UPI000D774DB0|nr:hypothetical protein [Pseudogracilibacillus auburnensis]MBO1002968.1 hypothetical protein [Pseudogracilibacillus auburnensis]